MQTNTQPLNTGVIIVRDPEHNRRSIALPAAASGRSVTLDLTRGDGKLEKPRTIQIEDAPSAATIELHSGSGPAWSLVLRTTHQVSNLTIQEINYIVNEYSINDFITEGLGILVVGKTGVAKDDTLGRIIFRASDAPPQA